MFIADSITGSLTIPLTGHRLRASRQAVQTILTMAAHNMRDAGDDPAAFMQAIADICAPVIQEVWRPAPVKGPSNEV